MKIFVLCNDWQKEELSAKASAPGVEFHFFPQWPSKIDQSYEVWCLLETYFIENEFKSHKEKYEQVFSGKPVFINSTVETLAEMGLRENYLRICGWKSFLGRDIWEVATQATHIHSSVERLGWNLKQVADKPGLVAPRVISMIINEAHFALREKISTREEIDLAMKLGTNYPYGPFEWEEIIGPDNILALLEKLSKTDNRYQPALLPE